MLCGVVASDLLRKYFSLTTEMINLFKKKFLAYPEDSNITAKVSASFVKIPSRSFLLIPKTLKSLKGSHTRLGSTICFSHL